jgi:hypothetical protein
MSRKVLYALFLGLIAFATTAPKAEEVEQWVKDSADHPVAVGVAAGAATAAGSVAMGALHLDNYNRDAKYWAKLSDMKDNPFFRNAVEPYSWEKSQVTLEGKSIQDELTKAQFRLEAVFKNGDGKSGVAFGLQRDIKDLQTRLNQNLLRQRDLEAKIEEVREYLAAGGSVSNRFSAEERYRLNEFTHLYQKDLKESKGMLKHAASLRAQGKQSFKKSLEWALLGIPVGTVAPFILNKIRESAIEDQKQEKALAESHLGAVNPSPDAIWTAGVRAK